MGNEKWTAGPLFVVSYLDEHDRRGRNVIVGHDTPGARHRIHSAHHTTAHTVPHLPDAYLYAAAPDMADALARLLKLAEGDEWSNSGAVIDAIDDARAALAKAKGKTK